MIDELKDWRSYVHALLVTGAVFIIHWLSDIWGIEALVVNEVRFAWLILFMFYAVGIFITEMIVFMILGEGK